MNIYCRLSHLRDDVAGVSGTSSLDLTFLRLAEEVSREFDSSAGRHFYSYTGTRYFRGNPRSPMVLRLPHDLISVSSLTVDDDDNGSYEITLAADTDYWLAPYEAAQRGEPYWHIELNPNGTQLYRWPTHPRAIKVTGIWGYSNETASAGTIAAAISSTTATSVTMTDGHTAEAGDTLIVDSEQMYCSAAAGNTLTVQRGVNGTTAATHLILAAVTVRRYPRDIEEAVKERVVGLRWDTQSGYAGSVQMAGESGQPGRASYARWRATVQRYRVMAVA